MNDRQYPQYPPHRHPRQPHDGRPHEAGPPYAGEQPYGHGAYGSHGPDGLPGAQDSPYDAAYDPAYGETHGGSYGGTYGPHDPAYDGTYGNADGYGAPGGPPTAPLPPQHSYADHPHGRQSHQDPRYPRAPYPAKTAGGSWDGNDAGGTGDANGAPGTAHSPDAPNATTATATVGASSAPPAPTPRTGDPIIPPGLAPAALTAVLCVLLAATAQFSRPVTAVAVVLLQAVTAAGWYRLNGMWPARQGIALAFLGGVTADVALLATGVGKAPAVVLGTLGVWCLLVIVLQLRNHSSPDERLYALTAGVTSAALTVLATGHLAAEPDAVTVGALGVAAATLARALPLPSAVSVVAALLAAAGAGVAAGQVTSPGASGAVLGLAAGVCALIGLRVASYDFPSRFVHMTAGVALPLTAAVPAVYLLGRALA
ncbi:hypothetical protein F0L17_11330 [Streptomyces sp. TRM43335]|uniref:Uncharacterized protein n=1 Tax=Streptomyces taklimakanensis TaxID=2569853 RepID=A0A6G2BBR2_9ACTN|nr:hypothetical protein [Streptomyces taklimakanensis]MTE19707.1 hypothetical protein [Streptomyces taklimakanensis]